MAAAAAPQAGSSKKLNLVSGFSTTIPVSEANKVTFADKVYPAGVWLHDTNGFLYHTDGVKTLTEVLKQPVIDKNVAILTAAERKMITDFNKAGGFVATNEHNKINDEQLTVVDSGHINEDYLRNILDNSGIIKIDRLPLDVRAHMKFVATYDDLESLDVEKRKGMIFVIDASGDPSVESGWAIYVWHDHDDEDHNGGTDDGEDESHWVKIQEGEGIDYDYESLVTHDTVEKTGAMMYDHVLFLQSPTLDQLSNLADPVVAPLFATFPKTINDYDKKDINPNLKLTDKFVDQEQHKIVFSVASGGTAQIKGFGDASNEICSAGTDKTLQNTVTELNKKLAALRIVLGSKASKITMTLDDGRQVVEIDTTVKPFIAPTLVNCTTMDAIPTVETKFPVTLSTEGVDPDQQYTVTVTPTGCTMKDDGGSGVSDGAAWNLAASKVADVNAKLAKGKVVNDADGGTVKVAISGGASGTLTVKTVWAEPTLEGGNKVVAANDQDAALGVTLGTTNIEASKQHKVVITATGIKMKNDTAVVNPGTPITFEKQTAAQINEKLAKVKVTGATAGGSVKVVLDDGAGAKTKTVQVAIS